MYSWHKFVRLLLCKCTAQRMEATFVSIRFVLQHRHKVAQEYHPYQLSGTVQADPLKTFSSPANWWPLLSRRTQETPQHMAAFQPAPTLHVIDVTQQTLLDPPHTPSEISKSLQLHLLCSWGLVCLVDHNSVLRSSASAPKIWEGSIYGHIGQLSRREFAEIWQDDPECASLTTKCFETALTVSN